MENIKIYGDKEKNIVIKTITNFEDFEKGITVFRNAPYHEILSKSDMEEEYNTYVENGIALGCFVDGNIAGLNCIVHEADPKHSVMFDKDARVAYYSGLAVRCGFRGLGLGKLMVRETDKFLQDLKMFDYSYARILTKGSMSEGIFKRYGFRDIYDEFGDLIVDDVDYERNDPNVSTSDQRKYMGKAFTKSYFVKRR